MRTVIVALGSALILMLLAVTPASAQVPIEECGTFKESIQALVTHTDTDGAALAPEAVARQAARLSSVQNNAYCVAVYVASQARPAALDFNALVKRLESARSDKHAGGEAGTEGTSVVAQGPAAKVLSAAVEYGALTRGVEGQVVTLRGNLAGLPSALVQKNVFPYCPAGPSRSEFCVGHSILSLLRRVSVSASFDGARGAQVTGTPAGTTTGGVATAGTAQPVTFTADRRQLAGGSARLELWNRRDVTSKGFQDQWRQKVGAAMSASAADLQATAGDFTDRLLAVPGYDQWQRQTAQALTAAGTDGARVVEALQQRLDMLIGMARAAGVDLDAPASRALGSYSRFFLAQDDLIDSLARQPVVALEYGFSRPQGSVETRTARLIADLPLTTRTKLVANGAWTMYQHLPAGLPAGTSKTRDYQVGLQLEHSLGAQSIVGPAVLVLAAYHQAQRAPALFEIDPSAPLPGIAFTGLPEAAATVFTEVGDITLGQLKLVVAPGGGLKIPLSVTYSNRTELVAKPVWRAQVGLAYDLDALLGAVRK